MNCQEWEERIALCVAGDAPADEAAAVEQHVAVCAGCQVFWSGMKQSLEALREAHQEKIAPAHYAAVRARVLSKLERRARRWKRVWVYGFAIAAVAAVVMMVMPHAAAPPSAVVRPLPERRGPAEPPAPPRATVSVREGTPSRSRHTTLQASELAVQPQKAETILVKLETDNPDVVIYWIAERKGD